MKMESSGASRRGLLLAGGILSMVAGVFQIIEGWVMANFFYDRPWFFWWRWVWSTLYVRGGHIGDLLLLQIPEVTPLPIWQTIVGGLFVAMGVVAVVGGVSAVRKKSFGLSLAGAISVLPSVHLGIVAVIFVALGKREFRGEGGSGIRGF